MHNICIDPLLKMIPNKAVLPLRTFYLFIFYFLHHHTLFQNISTHKFYPQYPEKASRHAVLMTKRKCFRNMLSPSTTSHRTGQIQRQGGHDNGYIHHCDTHQHSSWIRGFKCRAMVPSTIIHSTVPTGGSDVLGS